MSRLEEIARINEEIKRIVEIAEGISMTAINAMLVARRAGKESIGFSTVARELRNFSERMAQAVQELSWLVFRLVALVAHEINRTRRTQRICQANGYGEHGRDAIAGTCVRSREHLLTLGKCVRELERNLLIALQRTEKQCVMGVAIGRSAKIEASYGSEFRPTLHQIAEGMEDAMGDMLIRVRGLIGKLAGDAA